MLCKLITKNNCEIVDLFQKEHKLNKGQILDGEHKLTETGYEFMVVDVNGTPTPYEMRVVSHFFDIDYCLDKDRMGLSV